MLLALLIALIALIGAGVLVGGGLYLAARRGNRSLPSGDSPPQLGGRSAAQLERTVKDIRVGDVLQHDRKDYLVEGVIQYNEDGHTWSAARLLDDGQERWLVVGHERGGALTLRLMELDPTIEVSGYPPEQLTTTDNTRFTQDKRGTATASASGEAGALPVGDLGADSALRCRWWRYESAGEKSLIVEQWGALYRVMRGVKLGNDDVELIPGS